MLCSGCLELTAVTVFKSRPKKSLFFRAFSLPSSQSTLPSPSAREVTTYYGAIQTCLLLLEWATGACVKETQRRLLMHNVACLLHESRRTHSYLRYAQTSLLRFVLDSCTASPRQIEMTGV